MRIYEGDFLNFMFSAKYKSGKTFNFKKDDKLITVIKPKHSPDISIRKEFLIEEDSIQKEIYISSVEMSKCKVGHNTLEIKVLRNNDYTTLLQLDFLISESVVLT